MESEHLPSSLSQETVAAVDGIDTVEEQVDSQQQVGCRHRLDSDDGEPLLLVDLTLLQGSTSRIEIESTRSTR